MSGKMKNTIRFETVKSPRAVSHTDLRSKRAGRSLADLVEHFEETNPKAVQEKGLSSAALRAGELIRRMRKEARLSQAELAQKLGVTQARISELEAGLGAQGPTWDVMERAAAACGTHLGPVGSFSSSARETGMSGKSAMAIASGTPAIASATVEARNSSADFAEVAKSLARSLTAKVSKFVENKKFGKEQIEAVQAATAELTDGLKAIAVEATEYSKKSFEDSSAFVTKLSGVKQIDEAVEMQNEFAKASYEGFVAQATKFSELYADVAKKAFRPVEDAITKEALKTLNQSSSSIASRRKLLKNQTNALK